jgi:DNA-binding NtrC family response regulator
VLDEGAVRKLERYGWPGNVRELKNVIESALLGEDNRITADQFSLEPQSFGAAEGERQRRNAGALLRIEQSGIRVGQGTPEALVAFLRETAGRRFRTAALAGELGIAASTARAYLAGLVRAGLVHKFGEKKGTTYQTNYEALFGEEER